MFFIVEHKGKEHEISIPRNEAESILLSIDRIEDSYYYKGIKWPVPRRYRPERIVFVNDRKHPDGIHEDLRTRSDKKREFEKKQMEEQRNAEAAAKEKYYNENLRGGRYYDERHNIYEGRDEQGRVVKVGKDGASKGVAGK